jgi:hypothetical protein
MPIAGEKSTAPVFHHRNGPKAIVLQLVNPFRVVERLRFSANGIGWKDRIWKISLPNCGADSCRIFKARH